MAALAREVPSGGTTTGELVKEDGVGGDSQPSGVIENPVYNRNPPSYPGYGSAIGDTMLRVSTTPPAPTSDPNIHDNAPPSHHHA
jgi:hypothetical protein